MRPRGLTPVGPRLRERDLPAEPARADEDRGRAALLDEKNLQPLPRQRVERVSDDDKTRRITGRCGTMPPPSEFRAAAASPTRPAWESCAPAPAAAGTSRPSG